MRPLDRMPQIVSRDGADYPVMPIPAFDDERLRAAVLSAERCGDIPKDAATRLSNNIEITRVALEKIYEVTMAEAIRSGWVLVPESGLGLALNILAMLTAKGDTR